jgi:ADP-ribose pyrophosphatase
MPSFKLLKSETLLEGRAFNIRRDSLQMPDGRQTKYEIVEHSGSVVLIPIDADGNLHFVLQYRQAAGQDVLELPAGTRNGDEPFEACAARELREEIGMAAGSLEQLAEFFLAPGYSTERMAVFLATDLHPDPLPRDADEFLQVEKLSMQEAMRRAQNGLMPDAKSLAALFLAREHLGL